FPLEALAARGSPGGRRRHRRRRHRQRPHRQRASVESVGAREAKALRPDDRRRRGARCGVGPMTRGGWTSMRARRGGGVLALAIALGSPSRASAEPSAPPSIDGGSSIAVSADATNADGIERAEAYAAAAYEAYSREDYAQAVALYLEAYAASPTAAILYNVARIYDTALHDATLAIRHYERYVSAPDADVYRAARARARLAQLRAARDAALAPERSTPTPVDTRPALPSPAPPHPAAAGELDARF